MTTAVSVNGLSKRYRLGAGAGYRRLSESLSGLTRRDRPVPDPDLWALRDVSFEVADGEVLGIIGRNGAGKSTLLKILSRITEPTAGRAVLHGRVGSLLEVGTGFHPELTGRENVYLNGAVLGMRRKDIERRFDEIVNFAEVERFLDTPVKRYSSGMHVRLAFAVAAHLEPEILVVDEVLAVGDVAFQKKCLGKMGDVASSGRTVLFVSHNMAAVRSLCATGVLLEKGRLRANGAVEDVLRQYLLSIEEVQSVELANRADREGDGRVRAERLQLRSMNADARALVTGTPGEIRVQVRAVEPCTEVRAALTFTNDRQETVLLLDSKLSGDSLAVSAGTASFNCSLGPVPLMPGRYQVNVYLEVGDDITDWVQEAMVCEVDDGDFYGTGRLPPPGYGSVLTTFRWSADRAHRGG